jgi:hypothetical protein
MPRKIKLKKNSWVYIDGVWSCRTESYVAIDDITCPGCKEQMDKHGGDVEHIKFDGGKEYMKHECGVELCLVN